MRVTLQVIYAAVALGCGIGCAAYGYNDHGRITLGNDGASLGLGIISAAALVMVAQLEISKHRER